MADNVVGGIRMADTVLWAISVADTVVRGIMATDNVKGGIYLAGTVDWGILPCADYQRRISVMSHRSFNSDRCVHRTSDPHDTA